MDSTLHPTVSTSDEATVRPSRRRRVALVAAAIVSCALPVVFTVNITRMLLVGELSGHRFHQLTGQGLVLFALWLGSLVPLVRAGWTGRRPGPVEGWRHLVLVGVGVACSIAAPGGGAPALIAVIAVTGGLLWLALPLRPSLRGSVQVDPVLAPLALLAAAVQAPYAIDQLGLQNAATGHHAQNPHYFDMAWLVLTLVGYLLVAAAHAGARRLAVWGGAGLAVTGAVGVALGEPTLWAALTLALGLATLVLPVAVGVLANRPTTDAHRA